MKYLAVAMFFAISTQSFAGITCPEGTEQLLTCVKADQRGDQISALKVMDSAVICKGASGLGIMLGNGGRALGDIVPVREFARMGATSYNFSEKDAEFSLIRKPGPTSMNSTFSMYVGGVTASRTLSCK